MWKARVEERTPKLLIKALKKATPKPILCKELLKQAYIIGKRALLFNDLGLAITFIVKKSGLKKIIQNFLAKQKEILIKETIEHNRNMYTPKIFYLVSTHLDTADDHAAYQGLIYIDKDYDKKDILLKDYVEKNNVKTIQSIIDKPIYMFVRPNCRHWFVALTQNEVLNCDISTLLKKYNMIDVYDKDKLKKQHIENRLNQYHRDLTLFKKLNDYHSIPTLYYMINQTKNFIKHSYL